MDHQLMAALAALILLPRIYGKSECMQVVGTLVCPQKPVLAKNVQIDLKDEDTLLWENHDQMGRTWSQSNGSFMISGCGADFGPFNTPDPYIVIEHKCPSILRSVMENNGTTRKTQFTLVKRKKRGSAVIFESDKWPNGRIPYVISSSYTPYQRAIIARAMAAYAARTCIRFTPRELFDTDYIIISKTDGCFADFAHVGGGPQQVSLDDECISYATVIHELMHVIGFIHEHQRNDRDYFVNILWQNIIPGANTDFEKLSSVRLSYYGESYDYFSIMHYESVEGSRNGKNTIEARIQAITPLMGKSADFSLSDIKRINRAYKC
ncbi:Astacin (Peptidase M12A) family protein [Acanthocheilonema viteae]